LEVFANVLKECEKAEKESWTDQELLAIAFRLRDAQDEIRYNPVAESIVTGTA